MHTCRATLVFCFSVQTHQLTSSLPVSLHHSRSPSHFRAGLALISRGGDQASAYAHVQGNLGALLLSADRPAEAIIELQAALQLGKQLKKDLTKQLRKTSKQGAKAQQQLQQQQQQIEVLQQELQAVKQQIGGIMFNLGKALSSVGR